MKTPDVLDVKEEAFSLLCNLNDGNLALMINRFRKLADDQIIAVRREMAVYCFDPAIWALAARVHPLLSIP